MGNPSEVHDVSMSRRAKVTTVEPGKIFDRTFPRDRAAEACAAMDEREAIKVLLRPSSD